MRTRIPAVLALLVLSLPLAAQDPAAPPVPAPADPAAEDAVLHDELRALKAAAVAAIDAKDFEALSAHLAPDVVVTWQDAQVSRGPDQVKAYIARMLEGSARIVKSFRTEVTVDALTVLYGGDTGVSYGSSVDRLELATGTTLALQSRWTATLVKRDGRWLIASFHTSSSLFDNPLLRAAKKTAVWAGLGGVLLGGAAGFLIARTRRKS